jgi:hypothetical protein
MTCRPRRDQAAQESATKLTPHPDRLTQAQPAGVSLVCIIEMRHL